MTIRDYFPSDFSSCVELIGSNTPAYFAGYETGQFQAFLERLPGPYLVLEVEGDVVACGGWVNDETAEGIAVLCWGMVARRMHRQGLGERLLRARLDRIAHEGRTDFVHIDTSQLSAGFFARFGFRTVGAEVDGYALGIDRVEMQLDLSDWTRPTVACA